ncbi:MAG: hypothetical protein K6G73_10435 [Marinilabiliaceae bacterium]|nr:hypothetical protein [Marinilabiliaceae bacterium]
MRRFTISLLLMLLTVASFAQFNLSANITNVPQGISYQAVVRDGSNIIAANEEFEVQITISAELANGTTASEYTETHTVKTNENGLFTLVIGQGSSSQQFSEFNWAIQGATYKIATQTPYGSDAAQLLSVPFAFYAANAGNIDTKAIAAALSNEDVQKLLNFVKTADIEALLAEYAKKDAIPTVPTNVSAFENDANYITEHQDISGKANKSEMTITAGDDADKATIQLKEGTSATVLTAHQSLEDLQNQIDALQSALENLKLSQIENDKIGDMPMATVNVVIENPTDAEANVTFLGKTLTSGTTTFKVPAYSPAFLSVALSKYYIPGSFDYYSTTYEYSVEINNQKFDPTLGYYYMATNGQRAKGPNSTDFLPSDTRRWVGELAYPSFWGESNKSNISLWVPFIDLEFDAIPIYKKGSGNVYDPLNPDAEITDAERNMVNQVVGPFTQEVNTIKITVIKKGGDQIAH